MRFRYIVFVPFLVLLFGTWIGGYFLNTVSAAAVVVDSSTGEPVSDVPVVYGERRTTTDADGRFAMDDLPLGARLLVQPRFSYADQEVPATATRVELAPSLLEIKVVQKNVLPETPVKKAEARQNDKQLATGGDDGNIAIAPYPEVGSKILICAPDYQSTEVEARGTQITVGLIVDPSGPGCPPLPSPSPSPSASPSGGAPTPSPTGPPAPTPTPTPTTTP